MFSCGAVGGVAAMRGVEVAEGNRPSAANHTRRLPSALRASSAAMSLLFFSS